MTKEAMFNSICDSFFEFEEDLSHWTLALESMANYFGAVGCDLYIVRQGAPELSFEGGEFGDSVEEYLERFLHREPRSLFLKSAKTGDLVTDLQITTASSMKKSEYYSDFLVRQGMQHVIAAAPLQTETRAAYLGIHFPLRMGAPSTEVLNDAKRMQVHLNRAIRAQLSIIDGNLLQSLYTEVFNNMSTGVIVLGKNGLVLTENNTATEYLRRSNFIRIKDGKLVAAPPNKAEAVTTIVSKVANQDSEPSGAVLLTDCDGKSMALTVTKTSESFRQTTGATAYVFLNSLESNNSIFGVEQIKNLFSLTIAEARAAMLLAGGASIREAASIAGVTYETMRSTIKSVFAKCKVKRQSQLVAVIHKSLAFTNKQT